MTNYERCTKELKGNIITLLAEDQETCLQIREMRLGESCNLNSSETRCRKCEEANKKWLLKEKGGFDFYDLQCGDQFTASHYIAKGIRFTFTFLHMWMGKMWLICTGDNGIYTDTVISVKDMKFLFKDFELVKDDNV